MKHYKKCQSCGMPLSKDAKGGGCNADGSINPMYCSHCFDQGKFLQPDLTAEAMTALVMGKLREMRIPGFIARYLCGGIKKLERWRPAR